MGVVMPVKFDELLAEFRRGIATREKPENVVVGEAVDDFWPGAAQFADSNDISVDTPATRWLQIAFAHGVQVADSIRMLAKRAATDRLRCAPGCCGAPGSRLAQPAAGEGLAAHADIATLILRFPVSEAAPYFSLSWCMFADDAISV